MIVNKILLVLFQLLCAAETASSATPIRFAAIPRGGGLTGKSASEKYRESLEEQILAMDRQLRKAQDEISQLRQRKRHFGGVPTKVPTTTISTQDDGSSTVDAEKSRLEEKVKILTEEINELKSAKQSLEVMNQEATAKVEELGEFARSQVAKIESLRDEFAEERKELQSTLNEDGKSQTRLEQELVELREQFSESQKYSLERIAQAEGALLEAEQNAAVKIEQIKKELETTHQEALEAEQQRSAEAVDLEKKKMRKLVKALAIREKKLAAKGDQ